MNVTVALLLIQIIGAEQSDRLSCGAVSLYAYCRHSGLGVTTGDLPKTIVGPRPLSHRELIRAGKAMGVHLQPQHIPPGASLPDVPMIMFLAGLEDRPGHFLFLNPIDPEGRQFQVIDAPNYPYIATEEQIISDRRYTGWILRPATMTASTIIWSFGLMAFGVGVYE